MKKLLFALSLLASVTAYGQVASLFKPYKTTDLRLPSVPLIVNDPYFSIWSPYDHLTDGTTRHWTNDEKPIDGMLRVDGTTYCFMGSKDRAVLETLAPMAAEARWQGVYTRQQPDDGWQQPDFAATGWQEGKGAFGSDDQPNISTPWREEHSDIYVRREVTLSAEEAASDLWMIYSHDDQMEIYINGTKVVTTPADWVSNIRLHLDGQLKGLLHAGRNVIAVHCHNNIGGALVDFGIYRNVAKDVGTIEKAQQTAVDVLATNTYYTYQCGPVALDLVFTAPMLIDDLDLLSTPVNYISYQVRSLDKKAHDIQLLLLNSPRIASNTPDQAMTSSLITNGGTRYLKTGTIDQPILAKTGDGICIDWGYYYVPEINGKVSLQKRDEVLATFVSTGQLLPSEQQVVSRNEKTTPTLAYSHDFGTVTTAASYALVGYDEVQDIEYMYKRYKGYWAHEGRVTIFDTFRHLYRDYATIMQRCRDLDKRIYDDGFASGGKKYAELLSGSYRHVIAAHKLFRDEQGKLLFFSKENNSNGCVNTVDLTYPESPLFLVYNPELQKAQITSILDYSLSGRWTKPFAAHDLGTYPVANGQRYGGDMPLEESGNILTLAAMISQFDGNTKYVEPYWDVLRTWTDYLAENGQDPANQLCTDDFAGHWAHNCNLSLKAIMGVASFAHMAALRGDKAAADRYMARAQQMADTWVKTAADGDHYRLAFDRPGTWSQKYNIVWDRLLGFHLFPDEVIDKELKFYLTKQNQYGLPLDIRKDYTKSDWIMWTASLSKDKKTFQRFLTPLWDYVNESGSRVPLSDWYDTKTALMVGFKARSVIGGHWMRVLMDKMAAGK